MTNDPLTYFAAVRLQAAWQRLGPPQPHRLVSGFLNRIPPRRLVQRHGIVLLKRPKRRD